MQVQGNAAVPIRETTAGRLNRISGCNLYKKYFSFCHSGSRKAIQNLGGGQ
jgi:hypothetical protein